MEVEEGSGTWYAGVPRKIFPLTCTSLHFSLGDSFTLSLAMAILQYIVFFVPAGIVLCGIPH